jgi:TM2 domain-containing membrane protein YozV
MKNSDGNEYKSPASALIWSMALPGFGQFYNGQILLGIILMILEVGVNIISKLNFSIIESFHGDFMKAHNLIKYDWGIYYPSIWAFSMWQAYNKARTINYSLESRMNKKIKLTGFFFGATVGMNLGLYWHFHFLNHLNRFFSFLNSPVFAGLIIGLIFALIGQLIEKKLAGANEN